MTQQAEHIRPGLDRRTFLRRGGVAIGGGALLAGTGAAAPLQRLMANPAVSRPEPQAAPDGGHHPDLRAPENGGYGPLEARPALNDDTVYLALPEGFEYVAFGMTDSPTDDGFTTPERHDGMAAFTGPEPHLVRLVRNHERGYSPIPLEGGDGTGLVGDPEFAYDRNSGGGTTTLTFDTRAFALVESIISINGTSVNCAGGADPVGVVADLRGDDQRHAAVARRVRGGGRRGRPEPGLPEGPRVRLRGARGRHGGREPAAPEGHGPVRPRGRRGRPRRRATCTRPRTTTRAASTGSSRTSPGNLAAGRAAADARRPRVRELRHPRRPERRPAAAGGVGRHRRARPGVHLGPRP